MYYFIVLMISVLAGSWLDNPVPEKSFQADTVTMDAVPPHRLRQGMLFGVFSPEPASRTTRISLGTNVHIIPVNDTVVIDEHV